MANRRNATPLFDLIGPLADTGSKPRYRSSAPPPAPTPPSPPSPPPAAQQAPGQEPGASDTEPQASTAVAEPGRKPIEVHTVESLSGATRGESSDGAADREATAQGDQQIAADESSLIRVIENKSAPHPQPAVQGQPDPRLIDARDKTNSFASARGLADLKQTLLTGTNRIYFTSGLVIIGLVVVWFVLNALLSSGAAPDIDTSAEMQTHGEGGIVDPLGEGSSSSAGSADGSQLSGRQVPTIEMGGGVGEVGTRTQPVPPGPTVDPRVPGQNYLHLASRLSRSEAIRAAAFLTEQGQRAIAVGMDSGTLQGNNTGKFLLISLFDVPVGRYSAMLDQRVAHVERVVALGRIWAKDHGGTVNFHDPYWMKYDR